MTEQDFVNLNPTGLVCVLLYTTGQNITQFTTISANQTWCKFGSFDSSTYSSVLTKYNVTGPETFLFYDKGVNTAVKTTLTDCISLLESLNEKVLIDTFTQNYVCILLYKSGEDLTLFMNLETKYNVCLPFVSKDDSQFTFVLQKYSLNSGLNVFIYNNSVLEKQISDLTLVPIDIDNIFTSVQEKSITDTITGNTIVLVYFSSPSQSIQTKFSSYLNFKQVDSSTIPCVCDKYSILSESTILYDSQTFVKSSDILNSYYDCLRIAALQIESSLTSQFQPNRLTCVLIYTNQIDSMWSVIKNTYKGTTNFVELQSKQTSQMQMLQEFYNLSGNPSFMFYKYGNQEYSGDISYINCYYILPSFT